jgi:hypothetical protein
MSPVYLDYESPEQRRRKAIYRAKIKAIRGDRPRPAWRRLIDGFQDIGVDILIGWGFKP